jgi:hypothetical protein
LIERDQAAKRAAGRGLAGQFTKIRTDATEAR